MNITATSTVRDLAAGIPGATRVFENFTIDYCCGGHRTLADACQEVSLPVEDLRRSLEDFLKSPTGTMSVVLSTQIQLTDEEKREAVEKLKTAYQRKQEQQAQAQKGGQQGSQKTEQKTQPKK